MRYSLSTITTRSCPDMCSSDATACPPHNITNRKKKKNLTESWLVRYRHINSLLPVTNIAQPEGSSFTPTTNTQTHMHANTYTHTYTINIAYTQTHSHKLQSSLLWIPLGCSDWTSEAQGNSFNIQYHEYIILWISCFRLQIIGIQIIIIEIQITEDVLYKL